METSKQNPKRSSSLFCKFCDQYFSSHEELKNHLQFHDIYKPYSCTICIKKYTSKQALNNHMKIHNEEIIMHNCNECDYKSNTKGGLNIHLTAHLSEKCFSCKECDFKTIRLNSLYQHHKDAHSDTYKCNNCDLEFNCLKSLTNHESEIHKNNISFACSSCPKSYTKKKNLIRHMKMHSGNNSEISLAIHAENIQSDHNNNSEEGISNKAQISGKDEEIEQTYQNNCIACKKSIKLKKNWSKYVINERLSFELNDYICELALKHWEVSWDVSSKSRICLSCKLNLESGKELNPSSKKRGRPKVKKMGFVTVCSTCHTEVRRTFKKHLCSIGRTKKI